jgi:hypothetical protein
VAAEVEAAAEADPEPEDPYDCPVQCRHPRGRGIGEQYRDLFRGAHDVRYPRGIDGRLALGTARDAADHVDRQYRRGALRARRTRPADETPHRAGPRRRGRA